METHTDFDQSFSLFQLIFPLSLSNLFNLKERQFILFDTTCLTRRDVREKNFNKKKFPEKNDKNPF